MLRSARRARAIAHRRRRVDRDLLGRGVRLRRVAARRRARCVERGRGVRRALGLQPRGAWCSLHDGVFVVLLLPIYLEREREREREMYMYMTAVARLRLRGG